MANLKITLIRSTLGATPKHRQCARALGLKKMHHAVLREDRPEIQGLINKISHLIRVEKCN